MLLHNRHSLRLKSRFRCSRFRALSSAAPAACQAPTRSSRESSLIPGGLFPHPPLPVICTCAGIITSVSPLSTEPPLAGKRRRQKKKAGISHQNQGKMQGKIYNPLQTKQLNMYQTINKRC